MSLGQNFCKDYAQCVCQQGSVLQLLLLLTQLSSCSGSYCSAPACLVLLQPVHVAAWRGLLCLWSLAIPVSTQCKCNSDAATAPAKLGDSTATAESEVAVQGTHFPAATAR